MGWFCGALRAPASRPPSLPASQPYFPLLLFLESSRPARHHTHVRETYTLDLDPEFSCPYQRLIYAVLLRAVRDYQFSRSRALLECTFADRELWLQARRDTRTNGRDALLWLIAPNSEPWSSRWCCESVGIPWDRLKAEVLSGGRLDVLNGKRI